MLDNSGDPVIAKIEGRAVRLETLSHLSLTDADEEVDAEQVYALLSPRKARRLARRLLKLADRLDKDRVPK